MSPLHVTTALFNPWRYQSRRKLYEPFRKHIADTSDCKLYVGELAFGDRPHEMTTRNRQWTDDGETYEIQWRTSHEIWHKERMINRLINELPVDWEYAAWVDADIRFVRPDWAEETVHMLQHYPVVQMFSHAQNLGPDYGVLKAQCPSNGFVYAWRHGLCTPQSYYDYRHGHPGFAWAIRRDQYEKLGGLLDISILGSGDFHMALAWINVLHKKIDRRISPGYKEQLLLWADRARKYTNRNLGYVSGLVNHYWHGNYINRKYQDRWRILVEHQYDPEFDLKFDAQGLFQWTDRCPDLAYDIRSYFATRMEDSIDVY